MDKITKALLRLSIQEKKAVGRMLDSIERKKYTGIDIKKLRGRKDIFRARKGNMRIIYRVDKDKSILLLAIERRSEKTYKKI